MGSLLYAMGSLLLAYVVDLIVGDPRFLPHPVVWMGKVITLLDRLLTKKRSGKWTEHLLGCLFPLILVSGVYFVTHELLQLAALLSPWLSRVMNLWLISTTISTKGLAEAGRGVYQSLRQGDLHLARLRLSYIVGRDTAHLAEQEIARGGIETVAENIVDAVTAPLFFAAFGGAPLALAYRAVNTLDSMVGYKNEKYLHFGFASARLDDVANFLPARLTMPFLVLTAWLLQRRGSHAWTMAIRDARMHPSPNSGWAEAAVAGALGIRLGGWNAYQGVPSFRAYLGDPEREIDAEHILQTVRILYMATSFYLVGLLAAMWSVHALFNHY